MTLTELKTAVLQELKVLASGEVAQADDAQIVGTKYISLYEMLLEKGLVSWALSEDIPTFAEIPVVKMLAYLCATSFGVMGAEYSTLAAEGALDLPNLSLAERMLRKQLTRNFVYSPATPDYF